jgi:hypothetical protein
MHTIIYNTEAGIIEIKYQGTVDYLELKEVIPQVMAMMKEKQCLLWINDLREATLILNALRIYEVVEFLTETAAKEGIVVSHFKRATITPPNPPDHPFALITSRNRGHTVRAFEDIDQARRWLTGKSETE